MYRDSTIIERSLSSIPPSITVRGDGRSPSAHEIESNTATIYSIDICRINESGPVSQCLAASDAGDYSNALHTKLGTNSES